MYTNIRSELNKTCKLLEMPSVMGCAVASVYTLHDLSDFANYKHKGTATGYM